VRVGGISLVANYRTEFDNLIRDTGVDGLIKALVAKNNSQGQATVAGAQKK
jgi:ABC-type transporter MlaC component